MIEWPGIEYGQDMKISKLTIRNFRSIKELDLDLDDTTVFIGPNNAGKSAVLECLRIALTRRWGQHGTGFTEHDIYSPTPDTDPRTLPPVSVEIMLRDDPENPWPEDLLAALEKITSLSGDGRNQIRLRISCAWNAETEEFEPIWDFLNDAGIPLGAGRQRATNLTGFFSYLPLFWLGALRDADDEFSPRSQHWGAYLGRSRCLAS